MATIIDTLFVAMKLDMSGFVSDANKAIQALDNLDKKADGASTAVVSMSDDMSGASNIMRNLTNVQEELTGAIYELTQKIESVSTALVTQSDSADEAADSTKELDQSNQQLSKSTDDVGKSTKNTSNVVLSFSDNVKGVSDKTEDWSKQINGAVKALTGLFTTIFVSSGLAKLVGEISGTNDKLYFMSKNLGMSAETIKKWQNAAEQTGGSAEGMAASMSGLSKSLWDFVTVGDASVMRIFNALEVGVIDSQGQLRNLDDILLDMADSFSKMPRPQAYNIAKDMGLDEGTINLLLEGKDAVQKRLDAQKNIVMSSEEELKLNRQLQDQNALLSQQWEGIKTIVANYLIPRLLKLSKVVSGFLDYLNQHRDTAVNIFKVLSGFLAITMIPILFGVGRAFLAAFAPLIGTTGIVLALVAALWLFYDDYQTWKEGKDSLFDWTAWDESITWILNKLDEFKDWFKDTTIGKWFTDKNGEIDNFKLAMGGLALFLGRSWLGSILKIFTRAGVGLLAFFGLPGLLVGGAIAAFLYFKDKIDSFDWDRFTDNIALLTGQAVKAADVVEKVLNADGAEGKAKAVVTGAAELIPGGKGMLGHGVMMADLGKKFSDIKAKNTNKQGLVDWAGVTKDIYASGAETIKNAAPRPKTSPNKTLPVGSKNANDLQGKAALDAMADKLTALENKYNLPEGILYAIAMTESGGKRFSISKTGAKGPFQFMPPTAKEMGLVGDDVFDWDKSGEAAAKYLRWLGDRHGNNHKEMIAAYNGGSRRVKENGMNHLPKETREYVPKVMKNWDDYRKNKKAQGVLQSVSDFQARLNQPIVPNLDVEAYNDFLSQGQRIQNMPIAGATNIKVDMNGNVNVYSNADTIKGTVADGTEAIRNNLSQLVSSMS